MYVSVGNTQARFVHVHPSLFMKNDASIFIQIFQYIYIYIHIYIYRSNFKYTILIHVRGFYLRYMYILIHYCLDRFRFRLRRNTGFL